MRTSGTYWKIEKLGKINMSDNEIKFTKQQKASIEHRNGSLLVSAAAGSGKTKVLVERLLSYIDNNADIDEFLVITYTRAAALELKEKIHEELLLRLSRNPGNKRLRRQALLCRGASIDTIHTICGELIRENSHLVNLPPDFRIADGSESMMIMIEVADSVITEIYDKIDEHPGFELLINTVARGRDDKQLIELVLDIYNKLRSLPKPTEWIKNQIEKQQFTDISCISETDCGAYMLKKLQEKVSYIKDELIRLLEEMKNHTEFEAKYTESVNEIIEHTDNFYTALSIGWDEAGKHCSFDFGRAKSISGYDELKNIRKNCISELRNCATELKISSAGHLEEMIGLSPAITAFMRILLRFNEAYSEEKRRRGMADFSDLEHLAVSLLIDEATGEKTDLARNLAIRFKEILIDEYQDVNAVQEIIFSALSQNDENIFMVGDVKQSIYRFRHADPAIFLNKYKTFIELERASLESNKGDGTKIHLSSNFRSRAGILETINHIFTNIMSTELGELEYTEKEHLKPGRIDNPEKKGKQGKPYINTQTPSVELNILDMSTLESDTDEESPAAIKVEAEHIASEIKKLMESSYYIPDGNGGTRPAEYSDIVILLRSMKNRAWQYAAALSDRGIMSEFPGGEGYFEAFEVSAALSLLSVIDNPLQDIPLVSVLGGPIYRFTSDELAEIRLCLPNKNYYDALKVSAEQKKGSGETSLKCKKILDDIEDMRSIASDMSADKFIWHVYNKTGLLGLVGAMRGGDKRRKNLILLAESARQFESSGYKGLFGFLTYVRSLQERGDSLPLYSDEKSNSLDSSDTVRIMSVHKSKGLEFPIVFLANTSKRFNFVDINKSTVFHSDLGIGTMLINNELRIKHSTLVRNAIRSRLCDEMYSEELRVLYVAMTRAKEKLIITATQKNATRTIEKMEALPLGKIAPLALMSMQSTSEWLIAGVRNLNSDGFSVNIIGADTILSEEEKKEIKESPESKTLQGTATDSEITDELPEILEYNYPFTAAIDLPSKLTVTGILKLSDPESESAEWTKYIPDSESAYLKPNFISKNVELTGAERGTLVHLVMQHIDYQKGSDDNDIANELQRLVYMDIISSEQVKEIDVLRISKLFNSELGSRMIKAKKVNREFKYSLLNPAKDYFSDGGEDSILIQGVIDCFFEEDDGLVVVDFKTDKITKENQNEKAKLYTPQLKSYSEALNRITGKKVKESYIYFFSSDSAHKVEA